MTVDVIMTATAVVITVITVIHAIIVIAAVMMTMRRTNVMTFYEELTSDINEVCGADCDSILCDCGCDTDCDACGIDDDCNNSCSVDVD